MNRDTMQTTTETSIVNAPAQQPKAGQAQLGAVSPVQVAQGAARSRARHYAHAGFKAGAAVSLGALLLAYASVLGMQLALWISAFAWLGFPLAGWLWGRKQGVVTPQAEPALRAEAEETAQEEPQVSAPMQEAVVQMAQVILQAEQQRQWRQQQLPKPTHDAPTRLQ